MKTILTLTSSRWGIIINLILLAASGTLLALTLGQLSAITGGNGIPDFETGYNAEFISTLFQSYGDEGMKLYFRVQFIDIFNPLFYSTLIASVIFLLYREGRWERFYFVAFLAGGLDYLENIFLYLLSSSYPEISIGLADFSGVVSIVKHVVMYAAIGILLVGIGRFIVHKYRA